MLLYRNRGRRGAAIDVYRTLVDTLRRELDAEPELETRAVFAEIGRSTEAPSTRTLEPALPSHKSPETASRPPSKSARPGLPGIIVVSGLVLALGTVAYWLLVGPAATPVSVPGRGSVAAAPQPVVPISVVVLPFANLSGDPSQEFFSDGMTEEVTTALAKVPDLRVVARTSAFQFKGQAQDVRAVAETLGASHLVEGAVRRDGTRVRINAQLIEARSGTDLWTESYDREFDDMFAVQDDIAEAIAKALRIPLGLQRDRGLTAMHIGDLDTYQKFRRAWAMVHERGYESLAEGTRLLEEVVGTDPEYAPAWAYLAQAYVFELNYHPAWLSGDFEMLKPLVTALMPKAEAAARRAIELDPNLADGYALLGLTLELRGELARAEDLYRQAMVLDPSNPDVLHFYSRLLAEVGYLKEARAMRQQLQAFDPFVPVYNFVTAWLFWLNGETDAAVALSESQPLFHRGYASPQVLASVGRYEEAAALIAGNASEMLLPGVKEAAADLLRSAPKHVASPERLPRLGWFNFVYVHIGALERTLEFYEDGVEAGYSVSASNMLLWHPHYAELRKTERYRNFMRKRGVVAYWRERGWPDLCRSLDSDDFACS
jgi:TolB-like protein